MNRLRQCAAANGARGIVEKRSDQQMPKGDYSIERRTGAKTADLRHNRRMAARAHLNQTGGQGWRIIARHAHGDGRNAGSIEDRLAAGLRTQTIAQRRSTVLAAIAVLLGGRRDITATIHRRGRVSGGTARVCGRAGGFVRAVLMAAEELELPVRAQTTGAGHAGKGRQRNHSPDDKSPKWHAGRVHSAGQEGAAVCERSARLLQYTFLRRKKKT